MKLSDCTGQAIANQVPFANKVLGTEPDEDQTSKGLEAAHTAVDTAEKLSDNKVPAKIAWGLSKAGLPALSETVENGLRRQFLPSRRTGEAGD